MSGKPIGRERNVVDGEAKVERQGEGLGQGPVGNREGNTGLGGQNRPGPGRPGNQGPRNAPPSAPRPGNGPKEAPQQADKGIISDLLGGGNNSGNNNGGILGGLMGGNNNNTNNNNSGLGGLGGLGGGNNGGYNGGNNGGNGGYNGPSNSVPSGGSTGGSSGGRKGKGKSLILILIIVVVIVVLGSCLIRSCTKRISDGINNLPVNNNTNANTNTNNILPTGFSFNDVSNNYYSTTSWESNAGVLNKEVAAGVPAKMTQIYGNNRDVVTIMVYLCGSDLESNYGSATSDLKEMLSADLGNNVNLILYTGGTTKWRNNAISSNTNQIYQIKGGQLYRLEKNAGDVSMTKEDTLSGFIQYCKRNFPANRNMLILWDHGGGSVEGYAHDEKYSYTGTLTLPKLKTAISAGGVNFDFIGFDACLMATVETGLALSDY